jgi:hypothetical protein
MYHPQSPRHTNASRHAAQLRAVVNLSVGCFAGMGAHHMNRAMKKSELPRTDSIQELALFWHTHDLKV